MIEEIKAVERELSDTERILIEAARDYKTIARSASLARFDYDQAWAQSMLRIKSEADKTDAKMNVAEKDALCTVAVKNEMQDVRIKESEADASKKYLSAVEAILSSAQTRARLFQIEASLLPRQ